MKKSILVILFASFILLTFNAYAHFPGRKVTGRSIPVILVNKVQASKYSKGAQIYNQTCFRCHQPNGMGIQGVFPPLKGSDFLKNASKKHLLEQVLKGSNELLTVNGIKYGTPMAPQVNNVSDAIEVVNYVLNAWGNNYGKATAADAKGLQDRQ